tara:strand:- start:1097 stop:2005 length:909 start_codon:yes stop_codon:yes gene_type:complete
MGTRTALPLLSILLLTNCAPPSVSTELEGLAAAIDAAGEPLLQQLDLEIAQDQRAARNARIAAGLSVYGSADACDQVSAGSLDVHISDCRADPQFAAPNGPGSASYSKAAFLLIKSYSDTANAIVASDVSTELTSSVVSLLSASNAFATAARDDAEAVVINEGQIEPLARLSGALSEMARARALRTLVNEAHDPLEYTIKQLIAQQTPQDGLEAAFGRLERAQASMFRAQSGPTAQYAAAVADYEAELDQFSTTAKNSYYARLLLIWRNQQLLKIAVNTDSDDLTSAIEILNDISLLTENTQ